MDLVIVYIIRNTCIATDPVSTSMSLRPAWCRFDDEIQ